jgi:hypothetical protein
MDHCSATTKAGKQCRARPLSDHDTCLAHCSDPDVVARRTAGNRAGGIEATKPPAPAAWDVRRYSEDEDAPLYSFGDIANAQQTTTLDLLEGKITAKEALARTKVISAMADRLRDLNEEEERERQQEKQALREMYRTRAISNSD